MTGTDTGVGKTFITTALIAGLRERGVRVAPMKPVETGAGDDAIQLRRAAGEIHSIELVRPLSFEEPLAPLVAARRAQQPIDLTTLDAAFTTLQAMSDVVVVEGAGGLLVPITETHSFATLFKRWGLELIVVAANRLGAINHTLLTVEHARTSGLPLRGVVLNTVSPAPPGVAEATNLAVLRELSGVPVIEVPHGTAPPDIARRLVKFLDA